METLDLKFNMEAQKGQDGAAPLLHALGRPLLPGWCKLVSCLVASLHEIANLHYLTLRKVR